MKNIQLFVTERSACDSRQEMREMLIKSAAWVYGVPKSVIEGENILRSVKGKPYFEKLKLHFSITHTANLWGCLLAPSSCGVDIEYIRPCNFEKIAGRFFSENEIKYVKEEGIKGFFDIWTAREAYGKYTGEGFFGETPELVSSEGVLKEVVTGRHNSGEKVRFEKIALKDNVVCTVCINEKDWKPVVVKKEWNYEDYLSFR